MKRITAPLVQKILLVIMIVAVTIAEAWCQPQIPSRTFCIACDCEHHHPGVYVEGCECCGGPRP